VVADIFTRMEYRGIHVVQIVTNFSEVLLTHNSTRTFRIYDPYSA
jgi:hypothetical protein